MIPSDNQSMWAFIAPSIYPASAAASALFPLFHGFMIKSAEQVEKPPPTFNMKNTLSWSSKGALVLGTQVFAQDLFQRALST